MGKKNDDFLATIFTISLISGCFCCCFWYCCWRHCKCHRHCHLSYLLPCTLVFAVIFIVIMNVIVAVTVVVFGVVWSSCQMSQFFSCCTVVPYVSVWYFCKRPARTTQPFLEPTGLLMVHVIHMSKVSHCPT